MKILVLSYEYPPIGGGGGEICRNISENLAKTGNTVTVLTTAFSGNNDARGGSQELGDGSWEMEASNKNHKSQISNLLIIRLPSRRKNAFQSNPLEMLSWISTTKKYIKNTPGFVDFDICMAHFVLPGGEVAYWLKEKYKLPYVLISHGHEIPWVHPRQMFFFHTGAYFWVKKVCRHSGINFIQTRKMKANIDRFLGEKYKEKNVIVPNGTDTATFRPDYSKRGEKLGIIFVGRLVIQKDPMTFLKAINLLSKYTHDFEVRITGDGNLRKKMEKFVEKYGLAENIRFLGKVPGEQMPAEYQAAHLMVAPSLNEGMSIAALEALNCGVYLIATRASGFEDMITEGVNGEFCDYEDWQNLGTKILQFYKNSFNPKSKSKRLNKSFYDWSMIAKKYEDILGQNI